MFKCAELNKEFETKEQLFRELKSYSSDIIALKKAQILKSCDKGISITAKTLDCLKLNDTTKGIPLDDNYYYIAVNSANILDNHKDLHLKGLWKKTIKDQQGKNYLIADHKLELDKTIVKKEYVEMFTAEIPFSMIGKSYDGSTEALIYKVRKDKVINNIAKEWLDSGDSIEASVRMQYVDIVLALASDDKDDIEERKNYNNLFPLIANKEDFEDEITYFWGVKQAKNVLESSLVLFGSNGSTGQISINTKEMKPLKNTSKQNNEPLQALGIDYSFLTQNIFKNK